MTLQAGIRCAAGIGMAGLFRAGNQAHAMSARRFPHAARQFCDDLWHMAVVTEGPVSAGLVIRMLYNRVPQVRVAAQAIVVACL